MKCPKCSKNQLRGKEGMKCKKCGYKFIFDPRSHRLASKRITDTFFQKLIDKTSRKGTYHFTTEEFHFIAARNVGISYVGCLLLSIFLAAALILGLFVIESPPLLAILLPIPIVAFLFYKFGKNPPSKRQCLKLLKRWEKRHGPIPNLIRKPSLTNPKNTPEPDTFDYGASHILITQEDIQVDWLIRNGFHTKNATIIISQNGYPANIQPHIQKLLTSPEPITLHLLHNTNTTAENIINHLTENTNWNLKSHPINQIGITPEMLQKLSITNKITNLYKNNFPVHALPYHTFAPAAALALTQSQTFLEAWNQLHTSTTSFIIASSDDGGDFG